ncbi:nuclear transport factor 2 family protein [Robiginitalea sp. SC105]|uniref:nuclear transport factor 2 family protein n=1 Tax=Robiginitalea sp. SC105 TaxID=2762332 RepID=UPI001639CF70|nr:nuclear transport factor 2 family protein [Robiginitalea sp. SC105]MBC2839861.1 nuclear transport factor 2 family protein [Robiginitalea sp. SC105]
MNPFIFKQLRRPIFSVLLLLVCSYTALSQTLKPKWEFNVVNDVKHELEKYREAMLTRNYKAMIGFWSNSGDFVMGSDGQIIGGYEDWIAITTGHYQNTKRVEQWDWENVHILPLSELAATVTLEFEFKMVDLNNEIYHAIGSWTYVFRKEDMNWKVIHSNGHHIKL